MKHSYFFNIVLGCFATLAMTALSTCAAGRGSNDEALELPKEDVLGLAAFNLSPTIVDANNLRASLTHG